MFNPSEWPIGIAAHRRAALNASFLLWRARYMIPFFLFLDSEMLMQRDLAPGDPSRHHHLWVLAERPEDRCLES